MHSNDAWSGVHRAIAEGLETKEPAMIVFDTLSSLWGAKGESTEGSVEVLAALTRLRDRYGCAVVLTHHAGWGERNRARGASALEGNVDDVLAVTGSAGW